MDSTINVFFTKLPHAVHTPTYATTHSAGLDLYAAVVQDVVIQPKRSVMIPTGITMCLPGGYEAQIRARSGLAAKHMVTVLNSPGTIDSDYRGEIKIILINHGDEPFKVERGMRVAQMVVARYVCVQLLEVAEYACQTERGDGGFGSTGV
jgi:dUTP pyrophosphatase